MARIELFGRGFDTDSLTTLHKIIIGAVLSVVILGAGVYYMLLPPWQQLETLNAEIETQENDIQTKQAQVKNLDALKKELVQIKDKLVLLRRKIPNSDNVAPLMLDLEEVTENQALYGNNAVLNDFKPAGVVDFTLPAELADASGSETAKQLKQLPVSIRITKISYPDLIKLLTDYESYERTLSLENLVITPVEDEDALYTPVDVSFTLKAFLLAGGS